MKDSQKFQANINENKNRTVKIEEAHKEIEKLRIHLALSKRHLDDQR